jgi:hypothetical protein
LCLLSKLLHQGQGGLSKGGALFGHPGGRHQPLETSPLEPDENGYLEYCVCQYIAFGTSPQDYSHKIGDVAFCCSRCHSGTGIKEERFALDLYPIKLKFEESESRETVKGWPFP